MEIRLSPHGAYRHQYHPDIYIEQYSTQGDHLHIVIIILP
jgi:hypothetical protein